MPRAFGAGHSCSQTPITPQENLNTYTQSVFSPYF